MKMAKASERDIDAAGAAMSVLNDITSGYYPMREGDDEEDTPLRFDPEDPEHLRRFYDLMTATLDASPGWPGRVIGGMCYVILYDANQIVDPDSDTLELHPRFAKADEQDATHRRSADTEGTGRITPDSPASPAPPQGEREAFEAWAIREGFNIHRDDSEKYREYHRTSTRWARLGWCAATNRAADWLRAKADEQEKTNAAYPDHAKAYPSWGQHAIWLRWLADDLSASTQPAKVERVNAEAWKRAAHAALALAQPAVSAEALEGWKEAAIAWEVCASIHRDMVGPKRDALYTTRQADFVRDAEKALARINAAMGTPPADNKENGNG